MLLVFCKATLAPKTFSFSATIIATMQWHPSRYWSTLPLDRWMQAQRNLPKRKTTGVTFLTFIRRIYFISSERLFFSKWTKPCVPLDLPFECCPRCLQAISIWAAADTLQLRERSLIVAMPYMVIKLTNALVLVGTVWTHYPTLPCVVLDSTCSSVKQK